MVRRSKPATNVNVEKLAYSLDDAASIFGISERTLIDLIEVGRVEARFHGRRHKGRMLTRDEVLRCLAKRPWRDLRPGVVVEMDRPHHASRPESGNRKITAEKAHARLARMIEARRGRGRTDDGIHDFTTAEAIAILVKQGGRCAYCREPAEELDHKVPVTRDGNNHHTNLQWLCRPHNAVKSNFTDEEFRHAICLAVAP